MKFFSHAAVLSLGYVENPNATGMVNSYEHRCGVN